MFSNQGFIDISDLFHHATCPAYLIFLNFVILIFSGTKINMCLSLLMSSTSNWPEHHSSSKLWTHCLPLDCVMLSPLHQLHICSAAQWMAQMGLGTPLRTSAQECYGSVEQWQSTQPIWKLLENQTHKLDYWTNQLKPNLLTVGNSNALLLLLLQLQCWQQEFNAMEMVFAELNKSVLILKPPAEVRSQTGNKFHLSVACPFISTCTYSWFWLSVSYQNESHVLVETAGYTRRLLVLDN